MEDDELSRRPLIGFPLGLALLLIMLICMSGFFTCYLNWDRIKSLFLYITSSTYDIHGGGITSDNLDLESHADDILPDLHQKSPSPCLKVKEVDEGKSVPVLMPGDEVPKFIAMACPRQPPVIQTFTIKLHHPTKFATS